VPSYDREHGVGFSINPARSASAWKDDGFFFQLSLFVRDPSTSRLSLREAALRSGWPL